MKERIRCLLLTFIIALVFCVNVSATEQTGAQLYYVTVRPDFSAKTKI